MPHLFEDFKNEFIFRYRIGKFLFLCIVTIYYVRINFSETRFEMFQNHNSININDPALNKILDLTEGWSGSDIQDLIKSAEYQPLKDLETATHWIITEGTF